LILCCRAIARLPRLEKRWNGGQCRSEQQRFPEQFHKTGVESIEPPLLTERQSYKKQLSPRDRVAGASQSPERRGTTPHIRIFERRRIAERRSTVQHAPPLLRFVSLGSGVTAAGKCSVQSFVFDGAYNTLSQAV